ncbi:Phosphonate ABC transporter phosphate-binding protein periplasmic component [Roseibacterium elongatum DSM 19469]|uniref:Phosphonate ABC transporter phosphate-binding protein periplasmic component n=1 Tax=Roseicyclus elongatus DSM 19469 TaxID=1294273 RepID=W8RTM5_9RHOB|nr:phosphonate ABC transporter substrate-binding protein [Roseibacterium elongatum]AHM04569.1 Phosphonate ABC transporter phosphate-binding protein periplasmic component [Roseibacterium elongatum DSM 19469]
MMKPTIAALALGATALTSTAALAQDADWRDEVPVFRIGLLGGENEADRLRDHACQEAYLEERLGVDVELFPASDYAGVLQGLLAGQLEFAGLGSSGYAGIYLQDKDAVEPLYTTMQIDGSLGYYSVMYTRADSGIETLEDMEGRSLAFADPNSTSGYLVPSYELAEQLGGPLEGYFGETGFGGGHEQAVVAVLNGQYDAGVTWTSGVGDINQGYSRGNLRSMVDRDMLDMSEIQIIWQSNLITNGPRVIRSDLPQDLKDLVMGAMMQLQVEDRACFDAINDGEAMGYWPINHAFYEPIINMRRELEGQR